MEEKKIAVCMATYNGEKYIAEQIKSILSELRAWDELIISDDLSTDKTVAIINKINDSRIKLFFNHGKHGYTYNFQNALEHAKADIYILSDQDDVWLKGRVEKTLSCLENCNFCVCNAKVVDSDLNVIEESRFDLYNIRRGFLINFLRTRYIGCCMAFDRNVYNKLFPFPERAEDCPHDFWIALIGELFFKSQLIEEPQMLYRRHNHNASNGGEKSSRPIISRIRSRMYCLRCLAKRR